MFKRLLVPLDETPRDGEALAVARELARRSGASIVLMHVEQPITDLPAVVEASQSMKRHLSALRDAGIDARSFVGFGEPVHKIAESAVHERPDLIIMAPHRRAWLDAIRHPSVTVRMLAHAEAPVLVWPEHLLARDVLSSLSAPAAGVLVPLDGSELAERALPFATRLAHEFVRPLLLLRVVTPVTVAGAGPYTTQVKLAAQGNELREARTYLGGIRKQLARETDLTVESMVLHGSPSRELVRIAGSHAGSVMVLSTHGRNGFMRALLGSVAADLVRESPIPVFVIPPRAWQERPSGATAAVGAEEPVARG
ncbi:MAG TPA: universal stress protein [Ktedonobacterales bacterium]|nr:universal stress protein [Ktedonobacterales bacterium]